MDHCAAFLDDVLAGLASLQRSIPGKYLWDEEGSRIFEAITATPAYYQDAAEFALTTEALPGIAARLGQGASVVEFGSGASRKIRQVLDALDAPARYVALDISGDFLESSAAAISADYPDVEVHSVCADYSRPLPGLPVDRSHHVLGYVPGTSIGNMVPDDARQLLANLRETLAPGLLLMGQDPNRDPDLLQAAYEGPLMTALHKNLLVRLRRELDASVDRDAFRHESRTFDNRVEPHLVALTSTRIALAGRAIDFAAGDSIRTDLSWKYTVEDFAALAVSAGWSIERHWLDPRRRFCLHLLRA